MRPQNIDVAYYVNKTYHTQPIGELRLGLFLGVVVARLVEVAEEEQEEEPVHRDPVDEDARVLARRPEQHLQLVAEDQHELHLYGERSKG